MDKLTALNDTEHISGGKAMKKILKWTVRFILAVLIIAGFCAYPTLKNGYSMYKEATAKCSVQDKVKEIRSQENYISIDEIPDSFKNSLLQSEDRRFYYHFGVDPVAVIRAAYNDIKAGAFVQGGSTIDQQLAKNMYFDFGKTMDRKAAELFVVHDLEADYSKDEILELYINKAYFGNGCYGLQSASNYYFGVAPSKLNQTQADELVYTLKCPNAYNPAEQENGLTDAVYSAAA
jgi:membrane peptidoglycan carboxypeptidase